ncbi:MAG: hypothetical protein M3Y77_03860, partial [Actinomycetota bacterium]|nr:hypothetical protein [Actinomycetota bacterium]
MDDQLVFVLGGDPAAIKVSAATWQSFSLESTVASAELSAAGSLSAVSFLGDEGQTHSDLLLLDMAPQLAVLGDAWERAGGALDIYSGA